MDINRDSRTLPGRGLQGNVMTVWDTSVWKSSEGEANGLRCCLHERILVAIHVNMVSAEVLNQTQVIRVTLK